MLLESIDEAKAAADRVGLPLMDYRSDAEKAGLQPLDASKYTLEPWARWITATPAGVVSQYELQPVRMDAAMLWHSEKGGIAYVATIDMAGIDWRQTLTPVNQAPVNAAAINAQLDVWSEDHARRSLAWQLAQLDADALAAVAAQLAQADSSKALALCNALDDALLGPAQPARDDDEYMLQAAAMQ